MAMTEGVSANETQQVHSPRHEWPAWYAALSDYRQPSARKATWQVVSTLLPYCCLWFLMIRSIQRGWPYAQTLALAVVAAAFLVRLFMLFHDCVHGSLFPGKAVNTFLGHGFGVLLFTPFDDWRFSHLRHHASYANLDARGFGDIWTMTRTEFESSPKRTQLIYRLYRTPLVLLGLGPLFTFLLRHRFPIQNAKRKEHMSVLFTNLLIAGVVMIAVWGIGWRTYLLIQLPVVCFGGAMGIWLFYVQHQFDGVYWARKREWDPLRAGMEGSSFYKLPALLRWFSADIGYHHVHHLGPRIPNYRLKECYDAVPALQARPPLTIRKSLSTIRLKVWDEGRTELVGFH